jgi:hypothetical protein
MRAFALIPDPRFSSVSDAAKQPSGQNFIERLSKLSQYRVKAEIETNKFETEVQRSENWFVRTRGITPIITIFLRILSEAGSIPDNPISVFERGNQTAVTQIRGDTNFQFDRKEFARISPVGGSLLQLVPKPNPMTRNADDGTFGGIGPKLKETAKPQCPCGQIWNQLMWRQGCPNSPSGRYRNASNPVCATE